MTRTKIDSNKKRVILDLSHLDNWSVNDGIDKETFIGEKFKLIEMPETFLWSLDLRRLYR